MFLEFIQNHFLLSGLWVLVVILIIASMISDKISGVKAVSNSMLSILVNRQNAVLVDIRSEKEFRAGHIVGSLHILDAEIDKDNLGKLRVFNKHPVIVVDATGLNSLASAKKLVKKGFKPAYYLREGVSGWLKDNLPLTKK